MNTKFLVPTLLTVGAVWMLWEWNKRKNAAPAVEEGADESAIGGEFYKVMISPHIQRVEYDSDKMNFLPAKVGYAVIEFDCIKNGKAVKCHRYERLNLGIKPRDGGNRGRYGMGRRRIASGNRRLAWGRGATFHTNGATAERW